MKKIKSLFQIAAEKYTSISSALDENKKVFLEGLSSLDLNKLYSGTDKKETVAKPQFSMGTESDTSSDPGGHESPKQNQPVSNANPELTTLVGMADTNSKPVILPNGDEIMINPITGEITVSSDNPNKVVIRNKKDTAQLQNLATTAKKIMGNSIVTTEDIMSALATLSTGDVVNTEHDMDYDESESYTVSGVKPAGDILVGEDEDNDVDEGSAEPMPSTSSDISMPTDSNTSSTSGSTGSDTSASSYMPTEKKDSLTGIDDSYVTETDKEDKSEKGEEKETETDNAKEFSKGAGELNQSSSSGQAEPEIGEEAIESNPSGKDSAFWVPGDDLLGLKDIVKSIAKDHGVPDAQETIGKDANGNLVKKPTTPSHTIPNMRQYVKTNPMPGQPMRAPGSQPVDISDLDGVMGMDTTSDKALNISLNFNF